MLIAVKIIIKIVVLLQVQNYMHVSKYIPKQYISIVCYSI